MKRLVSAGASGLARRLGMGRPLSAMRGDIAGGTTAAILTIPVSMGS